MPTSHDIETSAIAALYVTGGYALILPNYLGYDGSYPHPYVTYPFQNLKSAILSLNGAVSAIKKEYNGMSSFPLFSVGYS